MSNLFFNIRFGHRHLQLDKDWRISLLKNSYWEYNKPEKWFQVYCAFGVHFQ